MTAVSPPNVPKPSYPVTEAPGFGEACAVAEGVYWSRMPMPFALDHVNVWLVDGTDGWTIVDTGMDAPGVREAWASIEAKLFKKNKVARVLITHHHPDHAGMAGWLASRHDAEVIASRTEFLLLHQKFRDHGAAPTDPYLRFYRSAGFDAQQMESAANAFGELGGNVGPPPGAFTRVRDGDTLDLGGSLWRIATVGGHVPEQLSLYCPEKKLVITADQVLPTITPNVSVQPEEPGENPLGEWMAGSMRLRELVPDDVLVLPAHELVFHGFHDRLAVLDHKQESACLRMTELLKHERRVIDLLPLMYRVEMTDEHRIPASGETLARLHHLIARGSVTRRRDADGVDWFQAA